MTTDDEVMDPSCDLCGAPAERIGGDGWVCSEAGKTCWRRVLDLRWPLARGAKG